MKNEKQTFKEYFFLSGKVNLSLVLACGATIILFLELLKGSDDWAYTLIFYAIALVVWPLGNWIAFKRRSS